MENTIKLTSIQEKAVEFAKNNNSIIFLDTGTGIYLFRQNLHSHISY